MRKASQFLIRGLLVICFLAPAAGAAQKIHVIAFGKSISVPWLAEATDIQKGVQNVVTIKVRPLIVDGRIKEYVLGAPHEITDRVFTIRRAFRVNDALPDDSNPRWQWQRGGWILVDRVTGRISPINLPDFDPVYSVVSWYRDYVAYCGVGEDGKKIYAVVVQVGRRKPVLKKQLSDDGIAANAPPDSACGPPPWQRNPVRVSFDVAGSEKQTFAIRGQVVDVVNDAEEDDESK